MEDGQGGKTPGAPMHQGLDIVALSQLDTLLGKAQKVLLKCNTLFPFDPFPNTLIIDYNKVDIIYRHFVATSQTVSVPIARINHVTVDAVAFLATLKIEVKGMDKNPAPLMYLKAHDAHLAKNLLLGLVGAHAHGIDLSRLEGKAVIDKLVEIGRSV
ncbi:MAG TPA: hypothetical protein VFX84_02290 [Candidatus Saccharimonadales bacterium]|nr:hypothetical protein [Candidatus Saccharimonadales bacterium]